jgi:phenylacetate-CoA ligase
VVLTAEPVLHDQREAIEEAFGCEVYSFYGCREAGYVGVECKEHNGYHINCFGLYLEIVVGEREANPGEIGSILLTDLHNADMPLIRYEIGDLGSYGDADCGCGSVLRKIDFFAGRETDVFVTSDGSLIPGVSLCDRVIEDCKGIQQLQFVQNDIDVLEVKIVKGPEFTERDMDELDNRIESYFRGKINVQKRFVEDIPKERSGKTRFCISNVKKNL